MDYSPYFANVGDDEIHVGFIGPQNGDHFAGKFTPDELEAVAIKFIHAAQARRLHLHDGLKPYQTPEAAAQFAHIEQEFDRARGK